MLHEIQHPVVLFDGECNLCSSVVQFIIKHDPKKTFRYASLQSTFGQQVLQELGLPHNDFNSFILLENRRAYQRSTGALRVTRKLNGLWPALYGFILVPPFIRNAVYNLIGRKRFDWFGKRNTCWTPTNELKSLFIDVC